MPTLMKPLDKLEQTAPSRYPWSVDSLYRAVDAGVFDNPHRIELIQGELLEKMSQNPPHAWLIETLADLLRRRLRSRFYVREEKPLRISKNSEPTPDILVATGNSSDYKKRHPNPSDVMLLIEVADTSALFDTRQKALLYAQAGIVEYWAIILSSQKLIVHREPSQAGYMNKSTLTSIDEVALLAAPEVKFMVGSFFDEDV